MRGTERALRLIMASVTMAVPIALAAPLIGPLGPLGTSTALAQDLAAVDPEQNVTLVADGVVFDTETGELTAAGSVEVFYGDRTLTADRIIYNDKTKRIRAEGQIVLRDPTGTTVYARLVDLDSKLRDGLVRGAQSLIGTQGKLAAVEGRRVDDRYNVLSKAVYSPCKVCKEDPNPLWRIRARKIIHDEEKRQIHYEDATFDVFGVPVFWTPYFRHPDPTVERASGFLAPRFRSSTNYGYGAQVPYYWVIDEQSDLTFSPFFTTDEGVIGAAEYRRAFESGFASIGGSVTHTGEDPATILAGPTVIAGGADGLRGHLETFGLFSVGDGTLQDGTKLGWDINLASDDSYLRFFDFSSDDRLESEAFAYNYAPNGFFDARLVRFQSLRDNEPAGEIPFALPDISARREFADPLLNGEFGLNFDSQALFRNNVVDGLGNGFDVTTSRISIGADWEREWITPQGLALTAFGEVRGDIFVRDGDPNLPDDTAFRLVPLAGVEARYPLIWERGNGNAHIIEPIAQAIVAPYGGNDPQFTNEDSLLTEFDETNLFDRQRFSGLDAVEEGPRFNLGLRYQRVSNDGIRVDGTIGRSLRLRDADEFSAGTGLTEAASDWVASYGIGFDPYVTVRQRLRFADDFSVSRNEIGLTTNFWRLDASLDYVFLESDQLIDQPLDREEITAELGFRVTDNWILRGVLQRDLDLDEFIETGAGISYVNECCEIDFFFRRRFTNSDDVPASTSFGVQVRLLTLGGSDSGLFDTIGTSSSSRQREQRVTSAVERFSADR